MLSRYNATRASIFMITRNEPLFFEQGRSMSVFSGMGTSNSMNAVNPPGLRLESSTADRTQVLDEFARCVST